MSYTKGIKYNIKTLLFKIFLLSIIFIYFFSILFILMKSFSYGHVQEDGLNREPTTD